MRRIFTTLFVSFLLCLVFLIGVKSNIYAYKMCVPQSVGNSYYCEWSEGTGTWRCPAQGGDGYDPIAANNCCAWVNGSEGACDEYCFLPGTLVKSSTGSKKIEEIKVGDRVTSFVDNKITESKVSQIFERKRDFYYVLEAGDHKGRPYSVKASAEHPFYIGNNEYKKISELKKGDTVYVLEDNKLEQKTVTSNTKVDESTPVYNMTVDNTNTYFANGFAVHNKACTGCARLN